MVAPISVAVKMFFCKYAPPSSIRVGLREFGKLRVKSEQYYFIYFLFPSGKCPRISYRFYICPSSALLRPVAAPPTQPLLRPSLFVFVTSFGLLLDPIIIIRRSSTVVYFVRLSDSMPNGLYYPAVSILVHLSLRYSASVLASLFYFF